MNRIPEQGETALGMVRNEICQSSGTLKIVYGVIGCLSASAMVFYSIALFDPADYHKHSPKPITDDEVVERISDDYEFRIGIILVATLIFLYGIRGIRQGTAEEKNNVRLSRLGSWNSGNVDFKWTGWVLGEGDVHKSYRIIAAPTRYDAYVIADKMGWDINEIDLAEVDNEIDAEKEKLQDKQRPCWGKVIDTSGPEQMKIMSASCATEAKANADKNGLKISKLEIIKSKSELDVEKQIRDATGLRFGEKPEDKINYRSLTPEEIRKNINKRQELFPPPPIGRLVVMVAGQKIMT